MWSSSAVSGDTGYAWIPDLDDGNQDYDGRNGTGYGVVCVR
jgi:hypothetical protein